MKIKTKDYFHNIFTPEACIQKQLKTHIIIKLHSNTVEDVCFPQLRTLYCQHIVIIDNFTNKEIITSELYTFLLNNAHSAIKTEKPIKVS